MRGRRGSRLETGPRLSLAAWGPHLVCIGLGGGEGGRKGEEGRRGGGWGERGREGGRERRDGGGRGGKGGGEGESMLYWTGGMERMQKKMRAEKRKGLAFTGEITIASFLYKANPLGKLTIHTTLL